MSGGAFGNIQYKYGEDFLTDGSLVENVELMAEQLKRYGPDGEKAAAASQQLHARIAAMREQIAQMETELENALSPLRKVWRAADYHETNDLGRDDVLAALKDYNAAA